jgi:hypothetical protein
MLFFNQENNFIKVAHFGEFEVLKLEELEHWSVGVL